MKAALIFKRNRLALVIGLQCLMAAPVVLAQTDGADGQEAEDDSIEFEAFEARGRADDPMGVMPTEPVESIFGFDKTLLETPRGATSLSADMMESLEIRSIDDIALVAPGSFRQSFFGVGGSLDVRGNPAENYFRGVRRLNNPGNFPTPIGASDRIDVVRGPASPIMGPSKIGGYLNFVPKSAQVETGQYLEEPTGRMSLTRGSWDKNILTAEVGGPGEIAGQDFGYYLYGESETSGDYYDNTDTDQDIIQASFNTALSNSTRIEFGGMMHNFKGNQVAGWNRLTQDLIDNGTYITGTAQPIDTTLGDTDGLISREEYAAWEGGDEGGNPFIFIPPDGNPANATEANLNPAWELENVGEAQLDGSQTLVAPTDRLETKTNTFYFDLTHDFSHNFSVSNKSFYEEMDSINENAYGFSSVIDSWVLENQTIFSLDMDHADWLQASYRLSPSVRHVDFERGSDFSFEFFDRRDLTMPSTALDARVQSTAIDRNYDSYVTGDYTNYGLAWLGDFTIADRVGLVLGTRYDYVDFDVEADLDRLWDPDDVDVAAASESQDEVSWTASLNYSTPWGVTPYVTVSEQATIITDQGSEVDPGLVADGDALAKSELEEVGVKADLWDGRLYLAGAWFEQTRTNFNAQDLTSNNTTETEGLEFEARILPTDNLTLTAAYTRLTVTNLTALENGSQFSFLGAEDLPNIAPEKQFGTSPGGLIPVNSKSDAEKAGVPKNVYSATGAYDFQNGWGVTGSVQHVDSVYSGFSKQVKLPSYTLLNAGVNYTTGPWRFDVQGRNLTDETYFRSNFPDLFGTTIVKPERPRNWTASVAYNF